MQQERVISTDVRTRSPEELAYFRLKSHQEVLSNQLENLTERREDLARDLNSRSGADREGIEARLRSLDGQIQQVETDLASVSKDVAQAAPASISEPSIRTIYRGYGDDDMVGAGFAGAGITLVLLLPLIVRVFRRRRWVAPGTTTSVPAIGSNERVDRMEAAIDSIAVEIERVSENQRFMTRLMTETQLAGTIAAVRGSTEAAKAAAENSPNG